MNGKLVGRIPSVLTGFAAVGQGLTNKRQVVNSLENQADDVFDMCIERLFDMETDVKELIKKREIYQVLEIVTDKFEDATNVIDSIVVKYA